MIIEEYIETTWNSANKKHYIEKGYNFTKMYDKLKVLSTDLQSTSPIKVRVKCDCCGEIFERQRRKLGNKNLCRKCTYKNNGNKMRKKICKCGNYIDRPKDNDLCSDCRKKLNKYIYENDYIDIGNNIVKVVLYNRKGIINGFTFIDKDDVDRVKQYKWRISTGNYILGGEDNYTRLHNFIMNITPDKNIEVDHINRIPIDNRKINLKITTHKENCNNRRSINEYRYADLKYNDSINGEGITMSFWVQGCDFKCKNCHNSSIWDFDGGKPYISKNIIEDIKNNIYKNGIKRNLSILGGEPLHIRNIFMVYDLCASIKRIFPEVKIWVWTGYNFEDLFKNDLHRIILNYIDVLVDGRFIEELKDLKLKHRGSSNQRIIDVQKSLNQNKVILYDN